MRINDHDKTTILVGDSIGMTTFDYKTTIPESEVRKILLPRSDRTFIDLVAQEAFNLGW